MYTNLNGKTFYSEEMSSGNYFKKPVKYYCHVYEGFGIDAELFDEKIVGKKRGIRFIVKEPLRNYRNNKVVCDAGEYEVDMEVIERVGVRATLNEKHGEQVFVPVSWMRKI